MIVAQVFYILEVLTESNFSRPKVSKTQGLKMANKK